MMLDVSHVVEQQIRRAHVQPTEVTIARRVLIGHRIDRRATLGSAVSEIGAKLGLRVVPVRHRAGGIHLAEAEWRRRRESVAWLG